MEKLMRALFIVIALFGLGILLNHNLSLRSQGFCTQQQKTELEKILSNQASSFFPQCGMSGGFLPQQCDIATKLCWCVDKQGNKIQATESAKMNEPVSCQLRWFERGFLIWQLHLPQPEVDLAPLTKDKLITLPKQ